MKRKTASSKLTFREEFQMWKSEHDAAHKQISSDLDYILKKVSANGRPGLDASLKDIFSAQKEIQTALHAMQETMQPELDRSAFKRAAKKMFESNGFVKFCRTKIGATVVLLIFIVAANSILTPVLGTALTVQSVWYWAKKVLMNAVTHGVTGG